MLLKSPVINKPFSPLSAGSTVTTKKVCLLRMIVNWPQQRSRRISIILTPNLIVSHRECCATSVTYVSRVLSMFSFPSVVVYRDEWIYVQKGSTKEVSPEAETFFSPKDIFWQPNSSKPTAETDPYFVTFSSVMATAHWVKPSTVSTFPVPSRT